MGGADTDSLEAFVLELGRALSLAGTAVTETRERLTRIVTAHGVPDSRIVVLPTVLLVAFGSAERTTIESIPAGVLRLDQISALYRIVRAAEHGRLDPDEGLRRLRALRGMRPRYGPALTVFGHALMTVGLCLILRPTLLDVAVAAGLGALVGVLVLVARPHRTLRLLVPVLCATLVSAVTFRAVRYGIVDPGLRTLVAPLVTFLPGGALTTATVELASGEMVAGSSRLVSGVVQLLLLAFGIVAGADLAGVARDTALTDAQLNLLGWWAPWLGVLLFGLAVALYFSAPRGTLRWLLVVLLAAWVGQLAGARVAGAGVSGFVGALVMTPVALALARRPGGPPSQVTFLPAFWLLVPGALGLIGVTEAVGNPAAVGPGELVQPAASILAIALGVLCGASIHRAVVAAARPRPHRPGSGNASHG